MSHTNKKVTQSQNKPKHLVATETEKEMLAKKAEEANLTHIAKVIRNSTDYPYVALESMLLDTIREKHA